MSPDSEVPAKFEDFAASCDQELAFLVRDYGFDASELEQYGHECNITYRSGFGTAITAYYEVGGSPWLIVLYSPAGPGGKSVRKPLHQLARSRVKGWKTPRVGEEPRRQGIDRVLACYRELLEGHFRDLLEPSDRAGSPSPDSTRAGSFSARQAGLLRLLGGGVLFAGVLAYVYSQGGFGDARGGTFSVIGMGAPGAMAIIGLVELVTGIHFSHFSERWDALPGWKRGVLGVCAVLAAGVVIFGPILLYLWIRDG